MQTTNHALAILQSYIGRETDEFMPPITHWLRLVLVAIAEGSTTLSVEVRPDMCNPIGVLHGGIQCTIMDEAIAMATASLGSDRFHVNTNLSVDFLGMAKVGETLKATAHVIRAGKHLVNLQCELTRADGRIVARSTANMFQTEHPSFAKQTTDKSKKNNDVQ